MTLTTQQEQVLALISAGATIAGAAQSAGIHRNTIHNWLRSAPEFQQAHDQARQAKALYWQEQAEELAADALATIRTLMADPKTPAATRLRAAQIILNLAINPPKPISKSVHKSAQWSPKSQLLQELAEVPELLPDPCPEPPKLHNSAQRPTGRQQPYRRPTPKIGRNEPCPCRSGRKFKHCCLEKPVAEPSPTLSAA